MTQELPGSRRRDSHRDIVTVFEGAGLTVSENISAWVIPSCRRLRLLFAIFFGVFAPRDIYRYMYQVYIFLGCLLSGSDSEVQILVWPQK